MTLNDPIPTPARKRAAILISGRGSNMQAIVAASQDPAFAAHIAVVMANDPDAAALKWAADQGISTSVVDHRPFRGDRDAFDAALHAELERHGIELVVLAGFMRLLTAPFVSAWSGRLINIHPSLLPAFKGLDTHARTLAAGVKIAGCTVHFVEPEMDAGPIIAQAAVPVLADDTEQALAARILACEHRIYPAAVNWVASGRAELRDGKVIMTPDGLMSSNRLAHSQPSAALLNPSVTN